MDAGYDEFTIGQATYRYWPANRDQRIVETLGRHLAR